MVSGVDPAALRAARESAGLTQHELARVVGAAGGERISRWELGTSVPRPDFLVKLVKALDIPTLRLIHLDGEVADLKALRLQAGLTVSALAAAAIDDVRHSLAGGMFRGRWNKATATERLLLVAMAQVIAPDGTASSRHITALLNKTTPQLSTARKALIDKGIVESAGTGLLRFTMQGFGEFVRAHVDAPWYGDRLAAGEQVDLTAAHPPELPAPADEDPQISL
jgi:DNA-binding XRE family transcriptional regulator